MILMMRLSCLLLLALLGVFGFVSCATAPDVSQALRPKPALYDWYDHGGPGKVSVEISLERQVARFKRGSNLIGWTYVATGIGKYKTAEGNYKVLEKKVDKVSTLYGRIVNAEGQTVDWDAKSSDPVPGGAKFVAASMPYWMRITWDGVGMHGGPIPNPGRPASHGCIRIPKKIVPTIYGVVEMGTPVTIRRNFPDNQWMVGAGGLAYAP